MLGHACLIWRASWPLGTADSRTQEAESRGTHADSIVTPWMFRGLALDQANLGSWHPQSLGSTDLVTALYVVSFNVPHAAERIRLILVDR